MPKRPGPGLSEAQRHSYRVNRDRGLIVRLRNALCLPCIRMAVGQLKSGAHDHTHMTTMCPNAALSAVKARGQRAALIAGKPVAAVRKSPKPPCTPGEDGS